VKFGDDQALKLRLALLRLLVEARDEAANSFLLAQGAAELGFRVTRDQVRSELAWLEQQRLVSLFDTGGPIVATITERGHDIARGLSTVPGVAPFVPGS
jgi:Fe2+ or Zn2+ uptake regulation protein